MGTPPTGTCEGPSHKENGHAGRANQVHRVAAHRKVLLKEDMEDAVRVHLSGVSMGWRNGVCGWVCVWVVVF